MKSNKRIFLCHIKEDRKFVLNLFERLKDLGLEPWMDEKNLSVGDEWNPEIKRVIENAKIAVVCFSKKSVDKIGYYQKEIRMILSHLEKHPPYSKYFMPILIKNLKKLPIYITDAVNSSNYHAELIKNNEDLNKLIDLIYNICASDSTLRIKGIKGNIKELQSEPKDIPFDDDDIENDKKEEYKLVITKMSDTVVRHELYKNGELLMVEITDFK